MKKLLFALLIAIFICYTNQETEVDDVILKGEDLEAAWEKVKDILNDAKNWLKKYGLWDVLVKLCRQKLESQAVDKCVEKFNKTKLCKKIIKKILDWIEKKVI